MNYYFYRERNPSFRSLLQVLVIEKIQNSLHLLKFLRLGHIKKLEKIGSVEDYMNILIFGFFRNN